MLTQVLEFLSRRLETAKERSSWTTGEFPGHVVPVSNEHLNGTVKPYGGQ